MSCFVTCPQCNRHVRSAEPGCPFCGGTLVAARCHAPSSPMPPGQVHRAFLFAAAAASIGAGCSSPAPLLPYGPGPWLPEGSFDGKAGAADSGVTSSDGTGGAGATQSDAGTDASSSSDASNDRDE